MLQLGTGMQTIQGVTVFPDHADEDQYWYLPAHLAIARRPADDWPQFSFIKYRRAATDEGVQGGGFLMFTVELTLPEDVEREIRSKIPANARLTVARFDTGTVECVALNLQGPGGTTATVSDEGTFVAVQQILGARTPSLFGNNQAAFSLTLSAEGATLLESAFAEGAAPIGVIYSLTFTAMQPSLDVKITADFERIYNHFSAGLNANVYYVEIGVEAGIEELVQNGAIKIEVTNFSTDDDKAEQEKQAIDFFTQHLLQAWFTPTLTPGTLQGGMATAPRAGGGAGLFGPKPGDGASGSGTSRPGGGSQGGSGTQGGANRPPTPPPPPPAGGGQTPPTPPTPPGGGGNQPTPPTPPTPPGGGGQTPTPPTPPDGGGGDTPAPPTPPGGGTPTPTPPTPPAGEGATTRDLFVDFVEENGTQGVHGRYAVTYESGGGEHEVATDANTTASQLLVPVPADWPGGSISAVAAQLAELKMADADQLRAHAVSGQPILASGLREAELGMSFGEVAAPAGTGDIVATFRVPVTKTVVTASSPDALVAAVFPGGHLVQPGVYDCRRISGTNNFELIIPSWPGPFDGATGGAQ